MNPTDLKPLICDVSAGARSHMPRTPHEFLLVAVLLSCGRSETKPGSQVEHVEVEKGSNTALQSQKVEPPQLVETHTDTLDEGSRSESATRKTPPSPYDDVDLATVEISLERTRCWGWCPEYSVTIRDGGIVRYNGKEYVLEVGDRAGQVSEEAVRELLSKFKESRFLDVELACTLVIYDAPGMYLRLKIGDRERTFGSNWFPGFDFRDRGGAEHAATHKQLYEIAEAIDRTVGVEQWIGSSDQRDAAFGDRKR